MDIKNQLAIISGGASGLGEATARQIASQGGKVAVLDFNEDKAASVAQDTGGFAVKCDVTQADAVESCVDRVCDHFGQAPRIAISCAGIADAARIVGRDGNTSIPVFQKVIEVNLFGTYNLMTYAAKAMMQLDKLDTGERGVIINAASAAYEDGQLGQAAYAASKGAIASMCLPAAREFAKTGIRVMAIAPGLFHTPMMESLPDETVSKIVSNIPFPDRLGDPAEFGQLVCDIAQNAYLNGTVIRLDGAVRLPPR